MEYIEQNYATESKWAWSDSIRVPYFIEYKIIFFTTLTMDIQKGPVTLLHYTKPDDGSDALCLALVMISSIICVIVKGKGYESQPDVLKINNHV